MQSIDLPKILFFTEGHNPTADEQREALSLGVAVRWRNAMYGSLETEPCDGVAGAIPENYAGVPKAKDALKSYNERVKQAAALVNDAAGIDVNNPDAESESTDSKWQPNT